MITRKSAPPQANWWANVNTQIILFCCASLIVLWCTCGRLLVPDVKQIGSKEPSSQYVWLDSGSSVQPVAYWGEFRDGDVFSVGQYTARMYHHKPTRSYNEPIPKKSEPRGYLTMAMRSLDSGGVHKLVFYGPISRLHTILYEVDHMKPPQVLYGMPCTDFDRYQKQSKSVLSFHVDK